MSKHSYSENDYLSDFVLLYLQIKDFIRRFYKLLLFSLLAGIVSGGLYFNFSPSIYSGYFIIEKGEIPNVIIKYATFEMKENASLHNSFTCISKLIADTSDAYSIRYNLEITDLCKTQKLDSIIIEILRHNPYIIRYTSLKKDLLNHQLTTVNTLLKQFHSLPCKKEKAHYLSVLLDKKVMMETKLSQLGRFAIITPLTINSKPKHSLLKIVFLFTFSFMCIAILSGIFILIKEKAKKFQE